MTIIIDGEHAIMGRIASFAAKEALKGEDVVIVNCNKVIITGGRLNIIKEFEDFDTINGPALYVYLSSDLGNDDFIDLGKLNPLINDYSVISIECYGPSENIIVTGKMGRKKTNIILSKEDIGEIINKFSTTAKIPVQEGVFKVVVGTLIISAVIADIINTRFIIRKMPLLIHPLSPTFAR